MILPYLLNSNVLELILVCVSVVVLKDVGVHRLGTGTGVNRLTGTGVNRLTDPSQQLFKNRFQ